MADIAAELKVHEDVLMQAWLRADKSGIRRFLDRDFTMIVGATRPQLLDRPSFLEACESRFRCYGFQFGEAYARRFDKLAWFATEVDLDLKLGGRDWTGPFWITDLWRKRFFGRGWKLAERSLSRAEPDEEFSHDIHRLQLWR